MEDAARRGIAACQEVECNVRQCCGLQILFRELLILHDAWSCCFEGEIADERLRVLERELARAVEAAVRLVEGYGDERWIVQALVKLENRLGFAHAAEIVCRYVRIFHGQLRRMELSIQQQRILSRLEEQAKNTRNLLRYLLDDAAGKDREELRLRVADERSSIGKRLFFPGRKKTIVEMLDTISSKLDDSSSSNILSIDPKALSLSGRVLGDANSLVQSGTWLGQIVAVKKCEDDHRYDREAGVFQNFQPSHPNVIQLLGFSEDPATKVRYLVMEEKDCDLKRYLQRAPPGTITEIQAVDFMIQIAGAMVFLHGKDVCYRDLKLENIMVDQQRLELTLADFGHSKKSFDPRGSHTSPVGTVRYMAPEVLAGRNDAEYGLDIDVFSFGVAASEILCGTPLENQIMSPLTKSERIDRLQRGERPPLPESCNGKIKQLVSKCWEFSPQNRPKFESVYEELWKIRAELLTGNPAGDDDPGDDPGEVAAGPVQEQPTAGIQTLTITGENTVGSKLTATWEYVDGTGFCVYGFGRYRDSDSNEPESAWGMSLTSGTSIEHIVTPDDLGCHIGVVCLPLVLENGKLATRREARFVKPEPVSRDPAMTRKMDKFVRNDFATFRPSVDGQRIKLNVSRRDYHLYWHLGSTRNFRGQLVRGDVTVEVVGDRAMAICRSSQRKTAVMRFKCPSDRDMAVLVMRCFLESSPLQGNGNGFDNLSRSSTWPPV